MDETTRKPLVLDCECGFRATGDNEAQLVADATAHARDDHRKQLASGIVLSRLRQRITHRPDQEAAVTEHPRIVHEGDGEVLHLGASEVHVLAAASDTGGRYTVVEERLPPGPGGPPPHLHRRMDHLFFVLAGTVRFVAGDDEHEVGPGALVLIPREVAHTFANASETEPARFLEVDSPGGCDEYFRQLADLFARGAFSIERVRALQAAYDTHPPAEG